jgi:DNA-binding NarL/FixJ family response regulator
MDIGMKKHGIALLADNHPSMLAGVRCLLEDLFSVVVMVDDEASLVEAINKMIPDVLIVDLSLPVTGGCNIMRQLAGRFPDLKIIVLSIHDEPAAVQASLAAGVAAFVLKRAAATDLVQAVKEVRKGKTYISPEVRPRSM